MPECPEPPCVRIDLIPPPDLRDDDQAAADAAVILAGDAMREHPGDLGALLSWGRAVVAQLRVMAKYAPKGEVRAIPHVQFLAVLRDGGTFRVSATSRTAGVAALEGEVSQPVDAVYAGYREARAAGYAWQAARWFVVTEYDSGDVRTHFG